MKTARITLSIGIWLIALGVSLPAQAQIDDHLKCYRIRGDLRLTGTFDIDALGFQLEPGCRIASARLFCVPATKSNVAVTVRGTRELLTPLPISAPPAPGERICWRVRCPRSLVPVSRQVTDQFGTQTLKRFTPSLVCTPAVTGTDFCGDGTLNGSEACDGSDDAACPGLCQTDCTCSFVSGFPASGQTTCWDAAGTVITCTGTGHDGDEQAGAPLAYQDNGDGTITDLNTGLMWEKNSNNGSIHDWNDVYTWNDAFGVKVATLNSTVFAGYTDWRLPNIKELVSIVDYEATSPSVSPAFNNGCTGGCTVLTCSCTSTATTWSSSSFVIFPTEGFRMNFAFGLPTTGGKSFSASVRAVRGP